MHTHELCKTIEQYAPLNLQEKWDNAGLIIDNNNAPITGALICLNITETTINEAINKNCNIIISHHPIIFEGLKKIGSSTYIERCVQTAIKNDIAIYAAHTNLDSVPNGVSYKMSQKLNLTNCNILEPNENGTGYGIIGELKQAVKETDFINTLKSTFNCKCIKTSALLNKEIKTVALCGGSGAFLIDKAISLSADIYVCGDIKYHDYFKAENKILIADIGHFESEYYTKDIFYDIISKINPIFAIHFADSDKNPINCF